MPSAEEVKRRCSYLRSKRDPMLSLWQDLAEIFLPNRANFTIQKQTGERQVEEIYDGLPRIAARDLASALDGLMKPKTSVWFNVTVDDDDLAENDDVKQWFDLCRERMWKAIYNPKAGFIQRSGETDSSLTVFGWGALFILENESRTGLKFKTYNNAQTYLDLDGDGNVNGIGVAELLNANQALQRFGEDSLHDQIKTILKRNKPEDLGKTFEFIQLILPATDPLMSDVKGAFVYKSITVDVTHGKIMREGGFHEFPVAVPRWDTEAGQLYPRSPAMVALPDAMTLQAMGKTLLIAGERSADPPFMVPNDGFVTPIRTFPGGMSVFDVQTVADSNLSKPFFEFPTPSNLPFGREMQLDYRQQVEAAFFKNVLRLPIDGPSMTATEILERKEEFIRVLGPVFGRLENEYIGAIVNRVFSIMERAGAFGPRPEPLVNREVQFTFQSPIQSARKAVEVAGFSRTMEIMTPLANVQPEVFDNIDGDKIIREAPEYAGIPADWLRAKKDVDKLRQERASQQEQATMAAGAKPVADSIKSLAQADALAQQAQATAV